MIAAFLLIAHLTVQPGDTLSGIAASHGVAEQALETANPQIANPNLIYAGQVINLPGGGSSSVGAVSTPTAPPAPAAAPQQPSAPAPATSAPSTSGGVSSVPGVPQAFAKCVAWHESGNGQYAAYNGGTYGIITASGVNVNGAPLSVQKQAFSKLYAQLGTKPWHGDGCA